MNYYTGKLGIGEGIALITMLLLPNIYLSEPSISIGLAGSSAWLLKLVSGAIAGAVLFGIVYFYQDYITKYHQNKVVSFHEFAQGLLSKKLALVLLLAWSIVFEIQTILTLREFADHTLITALPMSSLLVIILLYSACITIVLLRGLEVILRTAYLLFIIGAAGIMVTIIALYSEYEFSNLMPWQGQGLSILAQSSVSDLGTWAFGIAVLVIAPNLQNIRTIRKVIFYGFGYTVALKALLIAAIVMVFGAVVAPERALLFYEIVQAVHLSQYLQRVDAIFIMIWLTGGLISMMLMQYFALTLVCQAFEIKDMRPIIPIATLTSAALAILPNSVVAVIQLNHYFVYHIVSIFFILTALVLAIGYFVKCRRDKPCVGAIK